MWRTTTITAYDLLDMVQIVARVRATDGLTARAPLAELDLSVQVRGSGEPDPRRWLLDACVGLAETL